MTPLAGLTAQSDASLGGHAGHVLGLFLAWLVAVLAWELTHGGQRRTDLLAITSTGLSGCIHLLVVPEHFAENPLYGVFFSALACAQLTWCWAYRRHPSPRLLQLGGLASAAVVILWVETRFVGVGFGPLTPGVEPLGVHDIVSTALELLLVVLVVLSSRPELHQPPSIRHQSPQSPTREKMRSARASPMTMHRPSLIVHDQGRLVRTEEALQPEPFNQG